MQLANVVIDLSHHNTIGDGGFHAMKDAGILGVIHKATQGLGYIDLQYVARRERALSVGFLWGAYHFGTNEDGAKQAEAFLATVGTGPGTLLVLDWETNEGDVSQTMTLAQAEAFVTRVHEVTGRWPVLYSGQSFFNDATRAMFHDSPLTHCRLWIARYAATPPIAPVPWNDWAMWQYTNGTVGPLPHSCPGVGNCDRDKFNEAFGTLADFWMG